MKWLRSKAKRLSLLALFALALQLGLSFGHVHHGAALAASATAAFADPSHAPDTGHDHDAHDFCAICATVAMANTLVDAAPPALPFLPRTYAMLHLAPGPQSVALDTRHHLFQSRAPPRS